MTVRIGSLLNAGLTACLLGCVRVYRLCLRPLLPAVCRYEPSCSEYFILAVQKYGAVWGACKGVGRVCRCHPWHAGGYDPP